MTPEVAERMLYDVHWCSLVLGPVELLPTAVHAICGHTKEVMRLSPDIEGWRYYCCQCGALVATSAEVKRDLASAASEPDTIGIVSSLPVRLEPHHGPQPAAVGQP